MEGERSRPVSQPGAAQVMDGRWKVEETLGSSHGTTTCRAVDPATGQEGVVKRLSVRSAGTGGAISLSGSDVAKRIELFEREAKVLSGLDHPAIPKLLDSFVERTPEDVVFSLVREYVPGTDLAAIVQSGKRFDQAEVVRIGREIASILEYLHTRSPAVVHRDIKPANVVLRPDGRVALVDFGAVLDDQTSGPLGRSTMVGTRGYMPAEQYEGAAQPASVWRTQALAHP